MTTNISTLRPASITPFTMLEVFKKDSHEYLEQPCNEKENITNAVYALLKFADFISKGLLEKLNTGTFGFHQKNSEILATHCLNEVYRFNFPHIMSRADKHTPVYRLDQQKELVKIITILANHIASTIDMKNIVKSKSRFVIPKGMSINNAYFATFCSKYTWALRKQLEKFEGVRIEGTRVFDVQEALMHTMRHITLVDSLIKPEKLSFIKDFVSEKMTTDVSYFINGYPHDMFVIDCESMKKHSFTSIYVATDRCISYSAFNGEPNKSESCTLMIYEKGQRKKACA